MLRHISSLITFQGRITRPEWWIVTSGVAALISVYLSLFGLSVPDLLAGAYARSPETWSFMLFKLQSRPDLFMFAPTVALGSGLLLAAATVKRFHDRGKSGWWALLIAVPVVGQVWVLAECGLMPGDPDDNEYGVHPVDAADIGGGAADEAVAQMRRWEATHPAKLAGPVETAAGRSKGEARRAKEFGHAGRT